MDSNDAKHLISVIIPVYNVEKYLNRCLDSVINQTYRNLQIILVDDGSSDRSGLICDDYSSRDNRVVTIHKENGGVSSARNAGLDIAAGEFIGFVDSDDYLDEDMYEYLYDIISSTGSDISQCGMYSCYADHTELPRQMDYFENADNVTALRRMLESRVSNMSTTNKQYRTKLFNNIRFRNYSMLEDVLLLTEIMVVAQSMTFTNCPKYYYYRRPDSLTTSKFVDKPFDGKIAIDMVYDIAVSVFPTLEEQARMRKIWIRFVLLDKIYASGWKTDREHEMDMVQFLRSEKDLILKRDYFTTGRKHTQGY